MHLKMCESLCGGKSTLKGVVAYVDIRTPFGNPEKAITQRLLSLGAIVESTRSGNVTHVIFRYGDEMTKSWAEKRGLYIVTPSWVKACVDQNCRAPEECYCLKEKEDKDLENDFNLIASRNLSITNPNGPKIHAPSVFPQFSCHFTTLHEKSNLRNNQSNLAVNQGTFDNTEADLTTSPVVRIDGMSQKTPTHLKPPPPGWVRLPSPQVHFGVLDLPSPIFPEEDSGQAPLPLEAPRPHLSDVLGSRPLQALIPMSPDVLNFVVRNLSNTSSNNTTKKVLMEPRKTVPSTPRRREDSTDEEIVPKRRAAPQRRKPRIQSRSSFRRELLKRLGNSSPNRRRPKHQKSGKDQVSPFPAPSKRRSRRPYEKVAKIKTQLPLSSSASPTITLDVDAEISVNSSIMNITDPDVRKSLENFVLPKAHRSRPQTRSSVNAADRPIELLFSGLNAFQRQTLITLLRSNSDLARLEDTPALNRRLCGSAASPAKSTTSTVTAIIDLTRDDNDGEENTDSEPRVRRWRLGETFCARTTTHLVVPTQSSASARPPRTVNVFKAVILCVPVVDQRWIEESAKAGRWLSVDKFLVPKLPRADAAAKMSSLFSTIGSVFVAAGTSPSPADLRELITLGGGSVSRRALGAELVVGQLDIKKPSVSTKWILDSIFHQKLLPFRKYPVRE